MKFQFSLKQRDGQFEASLHGIRFHFAEIRPSRNRYKVFVVKKVRTETLLSHIFFSKIMVFDSKFRSQGSARMKNMNCVRYKLIFL